MGLLPYSRVTFERRGRIGWPRGLALRGPLYTTQLTVSDRSWEPLETCLCGFGVRALCITCWEAVPSTLTVSVFQTGGCDNRITRLWFFAGRGGGIISLRQRNQAGGGPDQKHAFCNYTERLIM